MTTAMPPSEGEPGSIPRRPRPGWRVTAATLLAVLTLVVVGRVTARSLAAPVPAHRPMPAPTASSRSLPSAVGAPIDPGGGPRQLAVDANGVWVALWDDGLVVRIDPASRRITDRIPIGGPQQGPISIAAGLGAIWVANYADATLVRIDPASARVTARIPLGSVGGVATGAGAVWVTSGEASGPNDMVSRVDPRSAEVTARIPVPGGFQLWTIAADGHWVWAENQAGTLWRIDPASNRATRLAATLHWGPDAAVANRHLVAGAGMVWAASDIELLRLDPASGDPMLACSWDGATVQAAFGAKDGVVAARALWLAAPRGIARIDPGSGDVTGTVTFPEGGPARGLAAAGDQLWAINSVGAVVRIDPTLVTS